MKPKRINANALLGEGPRWQAEIRKFYWTDILAGKIFAFDPKTGTNKLVLQCEEETGAFVFNDRHDLLLFTRTGLLLSRWNGHGHSAPVCVFEMELAPDERFNDATCDARGRIFAGTMKASQQEGRLFQFSGNQQPEILLSGLKISNGMGFSPDNKIFYHTDSGEQKITAYQYDIANGEIYSPQTLYTVEASTAVPDGMTVDAAGNIWTALWGGSCVRQLSSQGQVLQEYPVPVSQPSSLHFGGEAMEDLFITSASVGETEGEAGSRGGDCYFYEKIGKGSADYPAASNLFSGDPLK